MSFLLYPKCRSVYRPDPQIPGTVSPEFAKRLEFQQGLSAGGPRPISIRRTVSPELLTALEPAQVHRLSWSQLQELEDGTEVELATAGMNQKLFVSRYLTALPSPKKLQAFIEADRERLESLTPRRSAITKLPKPKRNKATRRGGA